jgi:hypothetical protein
MIGVRTQLIQELVNKAGDWPERFYNYSLPYADTVLGTDVISGLAQCTRDLAPSECNRCLSAYTHLVSQLVKNDSTGISIKGYNCYLRYQLGTIKITAPPVPALPPPTQPVPVRQHTSPTTGSKSCSCDLVTCNLYFLQDLACNAKWSIYPNSEQGLRSSCLSVLLLPASSLLSC